MYLAMVAQDFFKEMKYVIDYLGNGGEKKIKKIKFPSTPTPGLNHTTLVLMEKPDKIKPKGLFMPRHVPSIGSSSL